MYTEYYRVTEGLLDSIGLVASDVEAEAEEEQEQVVVTLGHAVIELPSVMAIGEEREEVVTVGDGLLLVNVKAIV